MAKNTRYFRVMRFRVLQGVFTLPELRAWCLANFPESAHPEIRAARYGFRKFYSPVALNWIAVDTEYCSIKVTDSIGEEIL